jgi:hypothetical protein
MNEILINKLLAEYPNVTIVAATKYIEIDTCRKLLQLGITNFGENKVDSLLNKKTQLNKNDIKWHFIGHLQSNKVNKIINEIDYLHSLDSLKLAKAINDKRITPLNCFIEINLTRNPNHYGILEEDLESFINNLSTMKNINICGFMTMGNPDSTPDDIDDIFKKASILKNKYGLKYLSMGMSGDYPIALKNNATHLRLGRILYDLNDLSEEAIKKYFNN